MHIRSIGNEWHSERAERDNTQNRERTRDAEKKKRERRRERERAPMGKQIRLIGLFIWFRLLCVFFSLFQHICTVLYGFCRVICCAGAPLYYLRFVFSSVFVSPVCFARSPRFPPFHNKCVNIRTLATIFFRLFLLHRSDAWPICLLFFSFVSIYLSSI